jgi:hypothetical protein
MIKWLKRLFWLVHRWDRKTGMHASRQKYDYGITCPHREVQNAICVLLMAGAGSLYGQSVRLADPSRMEFNDPTYGVSFRFPASWTYSTEPASIDPPTIIVPPDYESNMIPLRASVFAKKLSGVPSWPTTSFNGVEFSYAVREQTTPDDCRYLSLSASKPGAALQDVTLKGQTFHHGRGSGVGGGRGEEEEIFTASQGTSCLLFDLSEHFVNGGEESTPRAYTSQESSRIHKALMQVFESARIDHPSTSTELPPAGPAKEFVDPQFHVGFRYPASWSFTTDQPFYGAEAVLTSPAENSPAGFTARAIVFAKRFAAGTTLSGADFIFNVVPGRSLESCSDYLEQSRNLEHIGMRPVDGMPFFYATTGAAGMCHQVNESIYVHQAGGECYFFDLAIHTICTPEGGQGASPAEMREVRYQLQAILHSVVLTGALHAAAPGPHP